MCWGLYSQSSRSGGISTLNPVQKLFRPLYGPWQRADRLGPTQDMQEMGHGEIQRLRKLAELRNYCRAIERLKTRLGEDSMMEERDVRVAAKDLGVCLDERVIKVRKKLVGGETSYGADDGSDFGILEGVMDLGTA